MRIEDYALIGDTQTAALVGRNGSIDWLCLPRFDSGACFAALLGDRSNGRWSLAPAGTAHRVERRYVPGTLVLETTFHTHDGTVRVTDCMPVRGEAPDVVRLVEGISGSVAMEMDLVVRFDYGSTVPWVRRLDGALSLVAGPDALELVSGVPVHGNDLSTTAAFTVGPGDRVPFVLTWHLSTEQPPSPADTDRAVGDTVAWWQAWSAGCTAGGRWREEVRSSLVTLKALTYAPSGGIVAAASTSLPEVLGGIRNWDYRFCWLRDATFTLQALLAAGYEGEAVAWRDWLLRAIAGDPSQIQIMYGVAGERRLPELELDWLPGYEGSVPVRIGNAAAKQRQLDVYGEVMDALHQARLAGIPPDVESWDVQLALVDWLGSRPTSSRGTCSSLSSTGWSPGGASQIPACGRSEGRRGTSCTRKSCAGWRSTGRYGRWRASGWTDRLIAGGCCAARSTRRCASEVGTTSAARSPSPTGRPSSTPAC
jgi:GH15 family glucan-1,4-alpha-glucosidase